MANLRVTCPSCGKALEIGAEHDGQEVECGECFRVFIARGPGGDRILGTPPARGSTGSARTRNDDIEPDRAEFDDDDY